MSAKCDLELVNQPVLHYSITPALQSMSSKPVGGFVTKSGTNNDITNHLGGVPHFKVPRGFLTDPNVDTGCIFRVPPDVSCVISIVILQLRQETGGIRIRLTEGDQPKIVGNCIRGLTDLKQPAVETSRTGLPGQV
jgi:hypothetical protein